MAETLLTSDAATTSEGAAQQTQATEASATAADQSGEQQQATDGQTAAETSDASTTDAQAEGETQSEAEGATEGDKPAGAPEAYEDFTAPEGVTLDAEVTGKFKDIAKELNLPQEQAQKVADLGAELAQKWATQQTEMIQKVQTEWIESTKGDKEIGGDKLNEVLAVAAKARDAFGTPELVKLLNESGLGNHPEIIRAFYKAGKQISEDTFVPSGSGADKANASSVGKTLYPNSDMK